jgi:NitT/TauT family transport system ATP-binding protein
MMIAVENLDFSYPGHETVFEGFSFSVERGATLAIIGPSGGGKTTLLYLLAGVQKPVNGRVCINGTPLSRPRPLNGLVLQDHGLLPWATVRDNVALGLKIRRFYGPDGRHSPNDFIIDQALAVEKVRYWLERLDIADLADKFPGQLSRGQRQRTAIARTMTLDPDVLLMDEPFSALDAPTSERLQDLVDSLSRESDLTTVIVTHHIPEAVRMGQHILVIRRGINRRAQVVSNPFSGEAFRSHPAAFNRQCDAIRALLETVR